MRGTVQLELPTSDTAPGEARRFIGEHLDNPDTAETMKIVVSELVSNAVSHGGSGSGPITVALQTTDGGGYRVEVSQPNNPGFGFEPRTPVPTALSGRGLLIVKSVADEWGFDPDTGTVWATLG